MSIEAILILVAIALLVVQLVVDLRGRNRSSTTTAARSADTARQTESV